MALNEKQILEKVNSRFVVSRKLRGIKCSVDALRLLHECSCLQPGELSVRVRDQRRPVSGADHHERRRPEVSHLQHGHAWLRQRQGPVLRCSNLLRSRAFAQGIDRLQVNLTQS